MVLFDCREAKPFQIKIRRSLKKPAEITLMVKCNIRETINTGGQNLKQYKCAPGCSLSFPFQQTRQRRTPVMMEEHTTSHDADLGDEEVCPSTIDPLTTIKENYYSIISILIEMFSI